MSQLIRVARPAITPLLLAWSSLASHTERKQSAASQNSIKRTDLQQRRWLKVLLSRMCIVYCFCVDEKYSPGWFYWQRQSVSDFALIHKSRRQTIFKTTQVIVCVLVSQSVRSWFVFVCDLHTGAQLQRGPQPSTQIHNTWSLQVPQVCTQTRLETGKI